MKLGKTQIILMILNLWLSIGSILNLTGVTTIPWIYVVGPSVTLHLFGLFGLFLIGTCVAFSLVPAEKLLGDKLEKKNG